MLSSILLLSVATLAVLAVVVLIRSGRFFKAFAFTLFSGNAALFGVGYLAAFTGVLLAVNWFTVLIASLLGIPGVIAMLFLKLLFAA